MLGIATQCQGWYASSVSFGLTSTPQVSEARLIHPRLAQNGSPPSQIVRQHSMLHPSLLFVAPPLRSTIFRWHRTSLVGPHHVSSSIGARAMPLSALQSSLWSFERFSLHMSSRLDLLHRSVKNPMVAALVLPTVIGLFPALENPTSIRDCPCCCTVAAHSSSSTTQRAYGSRYLQHFWWWSRGNSNP